MKISGVYRITNIITGDFYIGSSKNVKKRWADHKCKSTWKINLNKQLYKDMEKYGVNSFELQILEEVEPGQLKEVEQQFIETLNPTYNSRRANTGVAWNGNMAEYNKEHYKKYKEQRKEQQKQYYESHKEQNKQYRETHKEQKKQYDNQLCYYNGQTLSLCALSARLRKAGIIHSTLEAKKYLIQE